jgi:hypothetical protein
MKDGYKNGYDTGFAHASAGKIRNAKPPIITSIAAGKTFITSYMSGYIEGYRKGKEAVVK